MNRHGDALAAALEAEEVRPSHEGLLRYRGGPEPIETLPERMITFAHLFAERCERLAAAQGRSFADVLEDCWPRGGRRTWAWLERLSR